MKAKKIFKGMTAAAVAAVLAASMVPMTAFAAAPGYDDLTAKQLQCHLLYQVQNTMYIL